MREGRLRRIAALEARIAPQRPLKVALIAEGQPPPAGADFVIVLCGVKAAPRQGDP